MEEVAPYSLCIHVNTPCQYMMSEFLEQGCYEKHLGRVSVVKIGGSAFTVLEGTMRVIK